MEKETTTTPETPAATVKQKIVKISNEIRMKKDGNNARFHYFKPDDILQEINPLLEKYGLISIFDMRFSKEKEMYEGILCIDDSTVKGINEDAVRYSFDIPMTTVQSASEAQNAGATQTYCKRYMLMNAFNIAENDADPDAKETKETPKGWTKPVTSQPAPRTVIGPRMAKWDHPDKDDTCKCGAKMAFGYGKSEKGPWTGWFCQNPEHKDTFSGKQVVIWGPHNLPEQTQSLREIEAREKGLKMQLDDIQNEDIPVIDLDENTNG